MDVPLACRCQPTNGVPSYAIVILKLGMAGPDNCRISQLQNCRKEVPKDFLQFCHPAILQCHATARDPGLTTGSPAAHWGHWSGSYVGSATSSSALNGTSNRAVPPLRSTIDAAPTTWAPAAFATSIVSFVDPPVVNTSSTTRTRSRSESVKPRRSMS